MNEFEKREEAMEQMYVLASEMAFKVQCGRDRVLAQWVAHLIGGTNVEAYIGELIDVRMTAAGDEGVIAKILADVREAGRILSEEELRTHMAALADKQGAASRRP